MRFYNRGIKAHLLAAQHIIDDDHIVFTNFCGIGPIDLVRFNIQGVYNGTANSGWNLYVYRDGSGVTESGLHTASGHEGRFIYAAAHSTGGEILEFSCEVFLSANNTNQTNIALWGGLYGSGTSYINVNAASGDRSFMTIEEVAQ